MKKILRSALATLAAVAGVGAFAASPASAASSVRACYSEPLYGWGYQPVQLFRHNGTNWVLIRSGSANAFGCAVFYNTPTDRPLAIRAYKVISDPMMGTAVYNSGLVSVSAGTQAANVGTRAVGLTCGWGSIGYCAGQLG